MEKQYRHKLPDLTIKTEGVEKLLINIVTSKACGPDNIPNIILKKLCSPVSSGPKNYISVVSRQWNFT